MNASKEELERLRKKRLEIDGRIKLMEAELINMKCKIYSLTELE